MKMTYIARVKGGMKGHRIIYTPKPTSRIIDGSYNSIYKGRSMNFDDLREYAVGDDMRDIDWKASARSRKLLTRQYIAEKKHNIMFVMDANRQMLGQAPQEAEKSDVALMAAGTMAYMVCSNGDYVGAVFSSENPGVVHYPFKTGLVNVENILAGYHSAVTMTNETDINASLEFIAKHIRRRMIIVVVTDLAGAMDASEKTLRELGAVHDILLIRIRDAGIYGRRTYDISGEGYIPEFVTGSKKLARIEAKRREDALRECDRKLNQLGISHIDVGEIDGVDGKIIELLSRHRAESRNR